MRAPRKNIKPEPKKQDKKKSGAGMKVINENPKKYPDYKLDHGFKYVEVEFTDKEGKITRDIVALHFEQIKLHK